MILTGHIGPDSKMRPVGRERRFKVSRGRGGSPRPATTNELQEGSTKWWNRTMRPRMAEALSEYHEQLRAERMEVA